ncbi:proteinase-activated receptor 1-like [Mantella aurantiaca]
METNFLLSLLFLSVTRLWSVDYNNRTSGYCGSNVSDIQDLKRRPCNFKPNVSLEGLELSEKKQKTKNAKCPQGAEAANVSFCSPTMKKASNTSNLYNKVKGRKSVNASDQVTVEIPKKVVGYLQSSWMTRFIPSFYTLVLLLSLPFNLIAMVIFLSRYQAAVPSVVYMLNLAVADVLFALTLPFDIVYRFSGNDWLVGEGMCRVVTAASYCNMYCSSLLMTGISADRFLAVVYPVRSLSWRTVGGARLACLFIWMVSIAGTLPLLLSDLTVHVDLLNTTTCYDLLELDDIKSFYFPYFTAYISLFFFLPLAVTVFCYAAIIRSLSSPVIQSPFKKSRAVLLCVMVLCEFVLCFGPTNILFFIYYLTFQTPGGDSVYFAYVLSVCISSVSCCIDPLIYYFGSSKCKKHVYNVLCCAMAHIGYKQPASSSNMSGRESSGCTL